MESTPVRRIKAKTSRWEFVCAGGTAKRHVVRQTSLRRPEGQRKREDHKISRRVKRVKQVMQVNEARGPGRTVIEGMT